MSRSRSRLTVLEVLALLLAMLLVATFIRPQWFRGGLDDTAAAHMELTQLAVALETYRHDLGKFPSTAQGLAALLHAPAGVSFATGWYGPYLDSPLRNDPWKHRFNYTGSDNAFRIWSYGADGVAGGTGPDADLELTSSY